MAEAYCVQEALNEVKKKVRINFMYEFPARLMISTLFTLNSHMNVDSFTQNTSRKTRTGETLIIYAAFTGLHNHKHTT